ncbi:MAG: protein-arginine deiminase [Labilithrix sp.]|nr:protein-arginine deiminase [Labilithrix sp.]
MLRRTTSRRLLLLACLYACGSEQDRGAAAGLDGLDLRADANRDGEIRFDESDANKTEWNEKVGAVFLANIDDDGRRCRPSPNDLEIARCNDAEDDIINGEEDARDLAHLETRPWPQPPEDAVGRVTVAPEAARGRVRLFHRRGATAIDYAAVTDETVFSREELVAGVGLAIEATDIVRDPAIWDGYVDVRFTVGSSAHGEVTDTVRMRVAPVLMYHHLLPAETVWVPNGRTEAYREVNDALARSSSKAGIETKSLGADDLWVQDFFEPAFMSMPGPGGSQHVIRVNYRSANVWQPSKKQTPLRPAGQIVFALRGVDVAAVQQFDIEHPRPMDGLNSTGNFETVPPYEKDGVAFPFGRVLRGSTPSFFPDKSFGRMLEAQRQQPPIDVDTSWLHVGHVDETLSFVKAPTPRGWVLLVNDSRLARKMLDDAVTGGHGDVPMFVGKSWIDLSTNETWPAEVKIKDVLADTVVMQASAEAAVEVDAQVAVLQKEIGLADDEIVAVPFLHTVHNGKLIAYQPGTVNGLYAASDRFAAPDPHGPVIDGKDIFKEALAAPLRKIGIEVDWIENWDTYHRLLGEVHCSSNATRKIPEARWWESGR